jgi:hypothetical protein
VIEIRAEIWPSWFNKLSGGLISKSRGTSVFTPLNFGLSVYKVSPSAAHAAYQPMAVWCRLGWCPQQRCKVRDPHSLRERKRGCKERDPQGAKCATRRVQRTRGAHTDPLNLASFVFFCPLTRSRDARPKSTGYASLSGPQRGSYPNSGTMFEFACPQGAESARGTSQGNSCSPACSKKKTGLY